MMWWNSLLHLLHLLHFSWLPSDARVPKAFFQHLCCCYSAYPLSIDWMNESKPENFLCPKSLPRLFFFIYFGNWRSLKKETAFKLSVKRRSSWITSSNLCWFSGIFLKLAAVTEEYLVGLPGICPPTWKFQCALASKCFFLEPRQR